MSVVLPGGVRAAASERQAGQDAQTRTSTMRSSASAVHSPLYRQIPSRRYGIPRSGIVVAQNDTTGVVTPLGPTRASGRAGKGGVVCVRERLRGFAGPADFVEADGVFEAAEGDVAVVGEEEAFAGGELADDVG